MDAIVRLQTLGLSLNEARVYAALLRIRHATVSDLVKAAHIHRPNVYAALKRLAERGFVTHAEGQVGMFAAAPPDIVFDATVRRTHRLLHTQQESVKMLQQAYRRRADNNRPLPFIEVRRAAAEEPGAGYWDRLKHIEQARREVLFVRGRHPRYLPADKQKLFRNRVCRVEIGAIRRRVRCRSIYLAEAVADPEERRYALALIKAGEESRVVDRLPTTFVVVDRQVTWVRPENSHEKGVLFKVNDAAVGEVFARAFESLWAEGEDAARYLERIEPNGGSKGRSFENPHSKDWETKKRRRRNA